MNEKDVDPKDLSCDTIYDSYCLNQIPKENLHAHYNLCRKCGRPHLILNHVHEDFGPKAFIDLFVRCSVECNHYVRIRVRTP